MIEKIKEILGNIKHEIEWVLAGCPKPVKIPVKSGDKSER